MGFMNSFFGIRPEKNNAPRRQPKRKTVVDATRPSPIAIIYKSELDIISRFILDYPSIETGGQLFGYWTATGTPVVCYVIGPGRHASHNPTSFVQDWDYLEHVGAELNERYRLQHIGEWHSHHQLGLAHPSGGDVNTMSFGVGKPGFPRMLLCIGNCTTRTTTVNAFNFHENTPNSYVQAEWDVVDIESPYRRMVDTDLQGVILQPVTRHASHGQMLTTRNTPNDNDSIGAHWLTERVENVEKMKEFVLMVKSLYKDNVVKIEMLKSGEPQISIKDANLCIKFPYGFPDKGPVLQREDGCPMESGRQSEWTNTGEDLSLLFGRWLTTSLQLESKPEQPEADRQKKEARMQRLGSENQILTEYFNDKAFAWSENSGHHIVNIIAYPFPYERQGVIRIVLTENFPDSPPEIQYGFYDEDMTPEPTLADRLSEIEYHNISELFESAEDVFCDLLKWESNTSMLKAYIVACIMVYSDQKAKKEGRDAMDFITPLLSSEDRLNETINKIEQKIKKLK